MSADPELKALWNEIYDTAINAGRSEEVASELADRAIQTVQLHDSDNSQKHQ